MLASFNIAFNAVMPFLVYLFIGWFIIRAGLADRAFMTKLNQVVFRVLFPFMMFNNVYSAKPEDMPSLTLVLIGVVGLLALIGLLLLIVPRIVKENPRRGVIIQAIFRSNFIIYGMSLTTSVFGAENTAVVGMMVLIMISLFNISAVVVLQLFNREGGSIRPGRLLLQLAKNPLLQGCVAGLLFYLLRLRLPVFLASPVSALAGAATPLAMITLGAALRFDEMRRNSRVIAAVLSVRLLLLPLAMLFLAWLLGLRGVELFLVLMIFGTPIATSSYPMAQNMGGDGQLAGQLLFVSTLASLGTIFLFIFSLSRLGLI